jgi:hypothetical protein
MYMHGKYGYCDKVHWDEETSGKDLNELEKGGRKQLEITGLNSVKFGSTTQER